MYNAKTSSMCTLLQSTGDRLERREKKHLMEKFCVFFVGRQKVRIVTAGKARCARTHVSMVEKVTNKLKVFGGRGSVCSPSPKIIGSTSHRLTVDSSPSFLLIFSHGSDETHSRPLSSYTVECVLCSIKTTSNDLLSIVHQTTF